MGIVWLTFTYKNAGGLSCDANGCTVRPQRVAQCETGQGPFRFSQTAGDPALQQPPGVGPDEQRRFDTKATCAAECSKARDPPCVAFDYRKDSLRSGTCRLYSVGPEDGEYRRGTGGRHDRELCFMEPRCALGDPSCRGMRFRIYNTRPYSDNQEIAPREVIFLEAIDEKRENSNTCSTRSPCNFLRCSMNGMHDRPCRADSKCPDTSEWRNPPLDTTEAGLKWRCWEERFQLYTTYGA